MFSAMQGVGGDYPYPHVCISLLENGFHVQVVTPPTDSPASFYKELLSILPQINYLAGKGAAQGMDDEVDPYKQDDEDRDARRDKDFEKVMNTIDKTFKPAKKGKEEYVFDNAEKLIVFLKELLSTRLK